MLRGRIIAVNNHGGTILAEGGSQLRFRAAEWRSSAQAGMGMNVEFQIVGAEAVSVIPQMTTGPAQNANWQADSARQSINSFLGNTFGGPLGFNQNTQLVSGRPGFWRFYFSPTGRVSLGQYWGRYLIPCFFLGILALGLLVALVITFFHSGMAAPVFITLIALLGVKVTILAWVSFVMHVKRFHDLNMSWQVGYVIEDFVPFGRDWMLFRLMCEHGTPGPNAYGDDPRSFG